MQPVKRFLAATLRLTELNYQLLQTDQIGNFIRNSTELYLKPSIIPAETDLITPVAKSRVNQGSDQELSLVLK